MNEQSSCFCAIDMGWSNPTHQILMQAHAKTAPMACRSIGTFKCILWAANKTNEQHLNIPHGESEMGRDTPELLAREQ